MPLPGLVIAFQTGNAEEASTEVHGRTENFEYLFTTSDAFVIIRNTILYNVAFIVINTTLQSQ